MARFFILVDGLFYPLLSLSRSVKLAFLTNIYSLAVKFGVLKKSMVGG